MFANLVNVGLVLDIGMEVEVCVGRIRACFDVQCLVHQETWLGMGQACFTG